MPLVARTTPVFVLGAGRAGSALAVALHQAGVPVIALHGRTLDRAAAALNDAPRDIAVTAGPLATSALHRAGTVLVAVRDAQVEEVLEELQHAPLAPRAVVLHLSGSRDPVGLRELRATGHAAGTFHPLVPLAGATSADRLHGAWIGIDGDPVALATARALVAAFGGHVLEIPSDARARYHAAAVIASNFPLVLAALAARQLRSSGVDPAAADGAVHGLMTAALRNLAGHALDAESVAGVLTGPVARGDHETIAVHLAALGDDETARGAYLALTRAAFVLLGEARGDAAAGAELVRRLEEAADPVSAGPAPR